MQVTSFHFMPYRELPDEAQEFAGLIPGSRVEIIEGAGHVPQWEQLDTVQPLVRDFLGA